MYVGALRGRKDAWCADKKSANKVPTYSESSGKNNMQAVLDYVQANDVELSQFPAFDWCNSLGEGWYIPSIKEMETFVNFLLGNDQEFDWDSEDEFVMDSDNLTTKELNARIHEAGGIPFIQSTAGTIMTMGTYTSTKTNNNKVYEDLITVGIGVKTAFIVFFSFLNHTAISVPSRRRDEIQEKFDLFYIDTTS